MNFFKLILILISGLALNLVIALVVEYSNFWHVKNYQQPLFCFGLIGSLLALVVSYSVFTKLKLLHKYPNLTLLIIVGILSNILERLYQGYVIDYLKIGIGVLNLADFQIYFGLVAIIFNEFKKK